MNRFAMEFATPDAGGIGVLKHFPDDKVVGLGVSKRRKKSPSSSNPMDLDEAYMKLRAMSQGARLLRQKYD